MSLDLQLGEAKRKLADAEARLTKVQHPHQKNQEASKTISADDTAIKVKTEGVSPSKVKTEGMSPSPGGEESNYNSLSRTKPTMLIPSAAAKTGSSMRSTEGNKTTPPSSGKNVTPSRSQSQSENPKSKGDVSAAKSASQLESRDSQEKRPKRKLGMLPVTD